MYIMGFLIIITLSNCIETDWSSKLQSFPRYLALPNCNAVSCTAQALCARFHSSSDLRLSLSFRKFADFFLIKLNFRPCAVLSTNSYCNFKLFQK